MRRHWYYFDHYCSIILNDQTCQIFFFSLMIRKTKSAQINFHTTESVDGAHRISAHCYFFLHNSINSSLSCPGNLYVHFSNHTVTFRPAQPPHPIFHQCPFETILCGRAEVEPSPLVTDPNSETENTEGDWVRIVMPQRHYPKTYSGDIMGVYRRVHQVQMEIRIRRAGSRGW